MFPDYPPTIQRRRVPIHDAMSQRIAQLEEQLDDARNENHDLRELVTGLNNVIATNSRIIDHLRTRLSGFRKAVA